jgi:hypothetical protein
MSIYLKHLLAFLLLAISFTYVYFGVNFHALMYIMDMLHPILDRYDYDSNFYPQTEVHLLLEIILGTISLTTIFIFVHALPVLRNIDKSKAKLSLFIYPLIVLFAYLTGTPTTYYSSWFIHVWIIALSSYGLVSLIQSSRK